MVQQTLNAPNLPHAPLNSGDGTELGDTAVSLIAKLQAMLTELYAAKNAGAKFSTNAAAGASTAAAGDLTGALSTVCNYTGIGAANLTTRTAAQMFADMGAIVGQAYEVGIMNTSGGTITLVGGTGVTITGTATIANNAVRWYEVVFNSATTMTFQNIGSGTV